MLFAFTSWDQFVHDFQHPIHIAEILLVAIILRVLLWLYLKKFVSHLVERPITRRRETSEAARKRLQQRSKTITSLLNSIGGFIIWTVAIIMIVSEFGPNVTPLVASSAIIGAALGFGAQQLVRDLLAGVSMLAEDQFGIGDEVDMVDVAGIVEDIGLRTTRIRDKDGTLWFVPNGEIKRLGNRSAST